MSLALTPSQTVGPFFQVGLARLYANELAPASTPGRITLCGRVLDADRKPIPDAMLEIWQADANGEYAKPGAKVSSAWNGWGRTPTNVLGAYSFGTIIPGAVPLSSGGLQAPHINVAVFMRGLLKHLVTRVYFPEQQLNQCDPVLQRVPEHRRKTLTARRAPNDPTLFQWDLLLQGEDETVFFDW